MKELEECLEALLAEVKPIEKTEYVALTDACDRILGEDIVAQMMIPPYPKSAMDGYAVRAEDTSGADREHPVTLQIVGELFAGDCAEIPYEEGMRSTGDDRFLCAGRIRCGHQTGRYRLWRKTGTDLPGDYSGNKLLLCGRGHP